MKLWIGMTLLAVGFILAVIGYAPIGSLATSLGMIVAGGLLLAFGIAAVLVTSGRTSEGGLDEIWKIRP